MNSFNQRSHQMLILKQWELNDNNAVVDAWYLLTVWYGLSFFLPLSFQSELEMGQVLTWPDRELCDPIQLSSVAACSETLTMHVSVSTIVVYVEWRLLTACWRRSFKMLADATSLEVEMYADDSPTPHSTLGMNRRAASVSCNCLPVGTASQPAVQCGASTTSPW